MIDCFQNEGIDFIQFQHGKVNAMDLEFCDSVIARIKELEEKHDCRAIILGSAHRVFSAGIDLKRFLAESPDYIESFMLKLEQLFQTVFCCTKPLVTEISGAAIAGGCMVATASDFRVIQPHAKIGILESRLGVPLPMTAIEIVRHVAAPSAFKEIITVGATFTGQEAVDHGLADQVADDSKSAAIHRANELSQIPLNAFRLTKRQRIEPIMRIVESNRRDFMDQYLEIWKSEETRSAIQTYVQQRLK